MSINDPRWGNNQNDGKRSGEQGPPDLEEIWRDFNRRLGGMLGRNRHNGGSSEPPGGPISPRKFGGGIGLVALALLAFWLGSGFYTVDASQRAVVLRFGKFKEITGEGLQWRLPYPFESQELVNVTQVRTVEVGYRASDRSKDLREALMLTDDENIINIQFAVQYSVADPAEFVFINRDPEATVKQAAETAMREIVGKSKMDFVLYEGREAIAKDAHLLMQRILTEYKTGIEISKVTMQNAQPPEQVQEAFNDAVKAGQDRERLKNEGQAYYNDVVPKAEGAAARLREEAKGYSARVVAQAEGDASRFKQVFAEYSKAPEVTRSRMYLDAMQQVFTNTSKILVDTRSNGNLLYMPLDKIMQSVGTPSNDVQAQKPATSPAPEIALPAARTDNGDYRSRDFRGRERGER